MTDDPKVECMECEGAGSWDVMTYLHWNGNSGWREERCERCDGRGWMYTSELTDEELAQIAEKEAEEG